MCGRCATCVNESQESIMLRSASAVVAVTTILVAFSFTEFWKQLNLLKKQRAELNSSFELLVLRYMHTYE